ncbi:MAG: FixH family protein [Phycisphaerales bacterium JB060]
MQDPTPATNPPRTDRAWVWPLAVVCILTVSMVVCGITVVAAVSDPSYAVEDDYYQKAVDWDHAREIEIASERLGWNADAVLTTGDGILAVTLEDAEGQPITGASVRAVVFHHARRGDARELVLQSQDNGRYTAVLHRPREGQWQVRLRVSRERHQFVLTRDIFSREGTP